MASSWPSRFSFSTLNTNQHHVCSCVQSVMFVATRRPSPTPSSPAVSRRSSWVDLPVASAPSSRRGSRVDLSIQTSLANTSVGSDSHAGGSHTKLAINQLLTNLSHVSQEQARMSSPRSSHSPALNDSPALKRKFEADSDSSTAYKVASAHEIHLPTDPVRRASIINLATAAAAAVLQSQAGQRRMSNFSDPEQKRQRVEQLGSLIEQARKASVTSMSHDMSRHVEAAQQNVAIATVLANHLGLTPQSSAASTPSAGTPAPASPTKPYAPSTLAIPQTPTTPRSPLSAAPLTASQISDHQSATQAVAGPSARATNDQAEFSRPKPLVASPPRTPSITLNYSTDSVEPSSSSKLISEPLRASPPTSQALFNEAKEAAQTYSRFYRFEKEWAQKALELERRRSSIRIDPLFNPNPSLSPLPADPNSNSNLNSSPTHNREGTAPISPQQHSAPESRIMSRRHSPFCDSPVAPSARMSNSGSSGSFSSTHRASSSGLANVLSNFAELIEHRQRSCSGLEALAKQAKELPVKRLSQPNPQFRTTFGDFSWAKAPPSGTDAVNPSAPPLRATPHASRDANTDADRSSVDKHDTASASTSTVGVRSTHTLPNAQSTRRVSATAPDSDADADANTTATARSTMSIASML